MQNKEKNSPRCVVSAPRVSKNSITFFVISDIGLRGKDEKIAQKEANPLKSMEVEKQLEMS